MIDLHEGVAEIFAEARRDDAVDYSELRFDSETARNITYEASYIAAARQAEGIERWRCAVCGEEVERRPGVRVAFHMGAAETIIEAGCRRVVAPPPLLISPATIAARKAKRRVYNRDWMRRKAKRLRDTQETQKRLAVAPALTYRSSSR